MPALNILIGGESFREIRELNCCYVDKTDILEKLPASVHPRDSPITRPCRFGKPLAMSMLREFFNIQKDGKKIFQAYDAPLRNSYETVICWGMVALFEKCCIAKFKAAVSE